MAFSAIAITAGSGTNVLVDDLSTGEAQVVKVAAAKLGTEALVKSFGTSTSLLSTGLNSLATSTTVGYASAEVDLTSEGVEDVTILGQFQMTTAGSPTGVIDVFALWSNDGTIYTGDTGYSGSAASYTLGAAGSPNLAWCFSVKPHANTSSYQGGGSLRAALGFIPAFFAVVVLNNSGIALHSSGSTVTYRVRY